MIGGPSTMLIFISEDSGVITAPVAVEPVVATPGPGVATIDGTTSVPGAALEWT